MLGPGGVEWMARNPAARAAIEPRTRSRTEMRWPAVTRGLGTVKDSASMASSVSHAAIKRAKAGRVGRT